MLDLLRSVVGQRLSHKEVKVILYEVNLLMSFQEDLGEILFARSERLVEDHLVHEDVGLSMQLLTVSIAHRLVVENSWS